MPYFLIKNSKKKETSNYLPLPTDSIYNFATKIFYPASIIFGLCISMYYCWKIGYLPKGISIGDSITIIYIVSVFSFLFPLLLILYSSVFFIFLLLFNTLRRVLIIATRASPKSKRSKLLKRVRSSARLAPLKAISMAILILMALTITTIYKKNIPEDWQGIINVSTLAFLFHANRTKIASYFRIEPNSKFSQLGLLLLILIASPIFAPSISSKVVIESMEAVGIRKANSFVMLDEDYHLFARNILGYKSGTEKNNFSNFRPPECMQSDEVDYPENREPVKAKILFSGIGSSSVVSINGCSFIIPNDKFSIAYKSNKNLN